MKDAHAVPTDYLPQYLCPHDDTRLIYGEPDVDAKTAIANCTNCGRRWLITAHALPPDSGTGKAQGVTVTMDALD